MRVHCINLDRRPDRLARFREVNRYLSDVVRVSAVDGQTLDFASSTFGKFFAPEVHEFWTQGALGSALSHLAVWNLAVTGGTPVTVCEDDAIFNAHFDRTVAEVVAALPPDWDFISWGWNFDLFMVFEMLPGVSSSLCQFEQQRMRQNTALFQTQILSPTTFKLLWSFGIPCYSVSPKGAALLKERLLPLRPTIITCPEAGRAPPNSIHYRVLAIDGSLNSVYRDLNAFVSFPPLAITRNDDTDNNIQTPMA